MLQDIIDFLRSKPLNPFHMRSRVIPALALSATLAVLPTSPARATLQQDYLNIYLEINTAQNLQQQGDYIGALNNFEDCYRKLAKIHENNPDWESALVVHRMADCQKMIIDLRPKADAQAQARITAQQNQQPPAPTPAPAPAPAPAPSGGDNTAGNPPPAPAPSPGSDDTAQVKDLKLQLNAVKEELRITREHLKESQAQLETYRMQLATVNEQLDTLKKAQTVDDRMGKLLAENKALNDKLAAAQKEIANFKSNPSSKLAMAQAQIKNLQGEYDASQAANKALQDTTTNLKQQLDQAQTDLAAANQKLATATPSSPDYATLKRENEVMREILTRELQEQAHRDMAKRLAQEEFDNLKLKSKVLQENLDILATPITPPSNDEERALFASLKTSGPEVAPATGPTFSAPVNGTAATPPDSTPSAAAAPDTTTNAPAVTIMDSTTSQPAPAPAPTPDAPPSAGSSAPASNPATAIDPGTGPVPPNAPLGTMPANTNVAGLPAPPPTSTDTNAPTKSVIPPPQTEVIDTKITHGDNSGKPAQPDPTQYATTARLPEDMRETAQNAADLFKNGKFDESAAKYQSIIDKYPESLYAWSNLGVVRFQQGKFEEALKALQQAVKLSPTDAFSYSNLGIVYYQLGQYENAIDALNSAKALDPSDAKTHNYLGCACSQKGWQEVAEKEFRKAIELDPNFGDAHFNLALVYATSKPPSLELARREYNRALELGIAKDARLEKLLGNTTSSTSAASSQ